MARNRSPLRLSASYARRAPSREPYDAVLIVCEGEKTEPNYFYGLRTAYRLSSANIVVVPTGRDPLNIVDHAIEELERDSALTRAYCVFDRDGHATYPAAMQKSTGSKLSEMNRLFAADSTPCFEIWPLLHFVYSTSPYTSVGGRSAGARILTDLQQHLPEYTKGYAQVFERLEPALGQAIQNAKQLTNHNRNTGSLNPSTKVHELVEYLMTLR